LNKNDPNWESGFAERVT